MQNKLSDLNNHLFAALERLGDEGLQGEALQLEIERTKAIANVATQVVAGGSLILKAYAIQCENVRADIHLPKLLEG